MSQHEFKVGDRVKTLYGTIGTIRLIVGDECCVKLDRGRLVVLPSSYLTYIDPDPLVMIQIRKSVRDRFSFSANARYLSNDDLAIAKACQASKAAEA